ncbi:MAG: acylphosphatase [Nitrososphaerales archaeon]|nr:acylphosphatase [Nitrososphaerales archaeon]
MNKIRVHVYISGFVQGIFFRSNTKKKAFELNLKGWVRNLHDGRVEAVFEGSKNDVLKMLEWCNVGPPRAQIIDVNVKWEEYEGSFATFDIIY